MKKLLVILVPVLILGFAFYSNKDLTKKTEQFNEAFPKAQIIQRVMSDMDGDGEKDLVIIFNNPISNNVTKSNICFITNKSVKAIDIAGGDLNFQFAEGASSLKILEEPKRASILMQDIKENQIIDYQIALTVDKTKNLTNFKIVTKPAAEVSQPSSNSSVVSPMGLSMPVFDHYSQTSSVIDWKAKYVGVTRVDNSQNKVSSATLIFTADITSTFELSGTTGFEVSAEKQAILAKVQGTASISGTASRSWNKGTKYGTESTVPAGKIGKITAYIPATTSKGDAVYKVYNTSTSGYYYENRSRGAIVPAKNAWNFVVEIPCA